MLFCQNNSYESILKQPVLNESRATSLKLERFIETKAQNTQIWNDKLQVFEFTMLVFE